MNIEERLRKYGSDPKNNEIIKHITGYKPNAEEVQLTYDGKNIYVKMDDLEKGLFDPNTLTVKKDEPKVETPVSEQAPIQEPAKSNLEEASVIKEEQSTTNVTLNDIKTLTELNNKDTLDNIIRQIDPSLNINNVLAKVSNNLIRETINSINDNRNLSTELYKYDKEGNLLSQEEKENTPISQDSNIENGFNNLKVYIETAKLYGVNYTDEQINAVKQNYINTVKNSIVKTPIQEPTPVKEENIEPDNKTEPQIENNKALTLKNYDKAGFADVLILAVIVIVYAAIIINLIMKLR